MTENLIHKQLLSYGNLPFTLVLRDLEWKERYLECAKLKKGIESFILCYPFLAGEYQTYYSEELEKDYLDAFQHYCPESVIPLVKNTLEFYVAEIKKNLNL